MIGGGGGGGGTSGSGSRPKPPTLAVAAPPTAPAPHLPADDTDGAGRECAGAAEARLAASSSSARFFASACRSLHVILPLEPTAGRVGEDWAVKAA